MDLVYREKAAAKLWRALSDAVVLVEGKNDERALREVGITAATVRAAGRTEKILEKATAIAAAGNKKIVLLFDYDAEGRRKMTFFEEAFFNAGGRASVVEWRRLRELFGLRTVEDLPTAYWELMDEIAAGKRRAIPRA
ncbi:MAG: hypothetical protein V1787_02965 [Candidatus Micrarchaeota archaeon]